MKFRFLGVIVVITNLAFGQQSNSLDSLSVAPVKKVQNSISLTPKDILRTPRDKMVLDSLVKKELDTISVDRLSRKKDSIQLEKTNKKNTTKKKKNEGACKII